MPRLAVERRCLLQQWSAAAVPAAVPAAAASDACRSVLPVAVGVIAQQRVQYLVKQPAHIHAKLTAVDIYLRNQYGYGHPFVAVRVVVALCPHFHREFVAYVHADGSSVI